MAVLYGRASHRPAGCLTAKNGGFWPGQVHVPLLGPTPVLVLSMQMNFVCFGLLRPVWGAVSDCHGRTQTMTASFALQSVLIFLWRRGVHGEPSSAAWHLAWVTGPTFAGYGVVFALMPSLIIDAFGAASRGW
jgi:nitrate/nitrite transporter NarK